MGICTDTSTDATNCGGCGTICTNANGSTSCVSSVCTPVCDVGYGDCDGNHENGCEDNLTSDPANCGNCGNPCPAAPPNADPSCIANSCSPAVCKSGFGDCNLDPSDGCEIDFLTDGANCNGCGIDCQGGGCNGGMCGVQPTTLHAGQGAPHGIAVDATNVYWAEDQSGIMKVPLAGGNPAILASPQQVGGEFVAVDATSVYWTGSNAVMKVSIVGGVPTTLAPVPNWAPYGLAADAASVYWTDYTAHAVMKVGLGGGNPMTLASVAGNPTGIAIDATSVYWLDDSIKKVPIGGGNITVLAAVQGMALAVDAASVYWTNWSGGAVMKCAISNCIPTTLATGQNSPDAIVLDATSVYWVNWGTSFNQRKDGTVMKVPIGGGSVTQLASAQHFPWSIAVDATSVYWTTLQGGTVMKVGK